MEIYRERLGLRSSTILRQRWLQEGFTLLEVLIAIVVLLVALLGMAILTSSIISYNQFADNVTTATTLAQDDIEELKNTTYSNIANSADTVGIYTRTRTVYDNSPTTNMKTIEVEVVWIWKGQTRYVVLDTIIAQ